MSNKEKQASRKMVKKERIAICPYFGCSHLKKIKPLKFGIFGFHKYPKCPKHKIFLVYTDDFIGNILHAVNACLFDVKSFLSENLMNMIKTRHQEERNAFFHGWMYCTSIGRGAQVVSNYMDGLSRAYMKVLSKKQRKALEDENYHTSSNEMICLGFDKIVTEYATFVKEFREKSALFYDSRELTPISDELQKILEMWLLNILNNIQLQSMKIKDELTPREGNILLVKEYYDSLLHAGTCALLLGKSPDIIIKGISPFELFSAYHQFKEAKLIKLLNMDEIKVLVKNLKVFLNIDGEYSLISQEEDVFSELGNMKNEKIDESLEESNKLPHLARFVDSNNLEDKLINDIQNELTKIGILSNGNLVTLKHKDHPRKELKNIEDGKVYNTEVSIKFGFREDYFNSKLRQNESFNSKALEQFRNEIEKLRQDETSLENIEINKCVDKIIELIDIYAEESKKLFIEQASHASTIKTEAKNGTSSREEVNEIIIVTREDIDEVELKWWSNFKKKYGSDNVKIKIIEKGDVILNQIIDSQKYRLFIDPNKEIPSKVQKIFSREDFIRPSSKYFKDAYEKGLYGSLLYRWTPLIGEYMNIPYLGFTTNDEKFRFGEHIAEAIEAYAQNRDAMTIKNAAIISVMKTCGYDDVQIKNFYDEMGKVRFHTMRLKVVGPIFNEILSKFKMEVVELDKTAIIGHDRETSYIKGEVDGRNYITHGLNSAYGSKESLNEINYPMYDICAMLMYGYSQGNIRKTLHQFYDLKVSKDMIKRLLVKVFYKTDESGENSRYLANKRFMKPIIEMITIEQILTREKKAKIITREEFQEIRALLQEIVDENDYRGRNTWLGQWLKGKEKLDFKQWQKYEPWKKSVDWESIKDLIMEKTRERKYYGILESKWIQWAIDHLSYTEITEKTMMTQKQIRTVYKKIASKTEIFNEFKKRLIIQCRKDGMSWKKIYENALEYKRIGSSFIESYFIKEYNYLFRGSISSIDKLNAIDFSKPEYEISPIWKTKRTTGDDLIIDFREYSNYLIP